MQVNPDIFKAYDIRGVYGKDFDDTFAQELANKTVNHFHAQKVVIARDDRISSASLVKEVVEGARRAGIDVIFIDMATTPLFYFSVHAAKADLGIMVTASHNPGDYNGFKVVGPEASIISGVDLGNIYKKTKISRKYGGRIKMDDFTEDYVHKVIRNGDPGRLNSLAISIDAQGAAKKNISTLVKHAELQIQSGARLAAIMDQDADRIRFFERGHEISAESLFAALVKHFGFESVVYDFRFSRLVRRTLVEWGVSASASRVGRLFLHETMKMQNADFGAEISGHFYFKEFGFFECPEMVLILTLKMIRDLDKSIVEITMPYKSLTKSPELVIKQKEDWLTIKEKLHAKYKDGGLSEFDGLTVDYPDWWFNIRPSHTEPVMRLVIEANKKDIFDEKVLELKSLLEQP